jgi:hypothetical protein
MTDIEHEFVVENDALRAELALVRGTAVRAIIAAKDAQDAAEGHHDSWLDDALRTLDLQGA